MRPSALFLLRSLTVVTVLTLAAALSAHALLKNETLRVQAQQMHQAGLIEQELQNSEVEQLSLRAQMLASDRDFVEYVAQSLTPDPARGGAIDKLSITDLLGERRQGYDVAMVLDPQGHLVSQSGVLSISSDRIAHDALITTTLHSGKPTPGAWFQDGTLYWVVVSPLMQNGALKGLLVTASQVGNAFFQRVAGLSDSNVVLMAPSSIVTASVSDMDVALQNLLTAHKADITTRAHNGGGPLAVHDDQRDLRIWVTPAQVSGVDLAVVAVYKAGSGEQGSTELFLIGSVVLFGAIIALLIVMQWWLTWRPLDGVLDVLDRAAKGDRTLVLRARGSAIVTRISESFNHMLNIHRS